jgi:RNA polymerase sigma factor (TIGR02999 family)
MNSVSPNGEEVTGLLQSWSEGDRSAQDRLLPLIYRELRTRAAQYLRRERQDHTLEPTALVHEAYLRLVDKPDLSWQNRAQFFAFAARVMRQVLVDHAREHGAEKRGGAWIRVDLDPASSSEAARDVDLILLDQALAELAALDEQQAQIVELRFFGGLSIEEAAEVIGISPATVKRDWSMARAWLLRRMTQSPSASR